MCLVVAEASPPRRRGPAIRDAADARGSPAGGLVGDHEFLLGLGGLGRARGVATGGAARAAATLARLHHQATAGGAGSGQGAVPEGEVAGRVAVAPVEDAPALARPLD